MKTIAYYRVSTREQQKSGLGLEAQEAQVGAFSKQHDAHQLEAYTEIESGRCSDRPELRKALNHARLAGAKLVVAKLDRLSRNVAFISALMDSGVDFVCCDNPHATPLTIHIFAAFAEDEAKRISQRTKDALAALKARGVLLGAANPAIAEKLAGHRGWKKAGEKGREVRQKLQRARYAPLLPMMLALRDQKASLSQIAEHLNKQGYVTSRGASFTASTVMRILNRQDELSLPELIAS